MPLNIKDEAVHKQAQQLARLSGTSITAAVRKAVATQLALTWKEQMRHTPVRSRKKLCDLAQRCASTLRDSGLSSLHDDLYDEQGLPR